MIINLVLIVIFIYSAWQIYEMYATFTWQKKDNVVTCGFGYVHVRGFLKDKINKS